MGNNAFSPLDLAAQLQLPVPGTTAAPEGDTSGANPFEFTVHPPLEDAIASASPAPGPGPTTPVPPAAPQDTVPPVSPPAPQDTTQTPDPTVQPVDPRTAISLPAPAQGTATASPSGWSGAPVVPPSQVPSGGEFIVHPAHIPLLPKPDAAEQPKSWLDVAKEAYQGTKKIAGDLVDDVAQGATSLVQEYAHATGQLSVPEGETEFSRNWDGSLRTPEQIESAQRGFALIATTALPEVKGANLIETAVPPSVKAKTLAWLSNHIANGFTGGLTYGALASPSTDPMDLARSATENALQFAWQAPALAGVFKGLGIPIKAGLKYSGLGPAFEDAMATVGRDGKFVLNSAVEKVSNLIDQIKQEGGDPKILPDDVKDQILAQAITEAAKKPRNTVSPERGLTPPTKFTGKSKGGVLPEMTPPREVTDLPDPGHEHQERLAQGVYRNPDGTVQTFGYRGVEGGRSPVEPGQMDAIYMTPTAGYAGSYGDVHYMEANFDNPLIIDDWHHNLGPQVERGAKFFKDNLADPEGAESYLGQRQPGVIWAARQLGHDGVIVRHGLESVEIVALEPHKVTTSGSADYIANSQAQQTVQDRAALNQGGVNDLGKANLAPDVPVEMQVANLIDQHVTVQPLPQVETADMSNEEMRQALIDQREKQLTGTWKVNGRVYESSVDANRKIQVTDVTGQVGADPTLHPDVAKASLVYDGISKGVTFQDLASSLEADHQVIAQKLLDYEPNPAEHGRISLADRNTRTLMSAMESIENGKMDDAILQLTQPREIEFPEESGQKVERRAPVIDKGDANEIAPDGRILSETAQEHLDNAQQLKIFGEMDEAAKRVKWAFEKDPVEAEKLVRENPAKYKMPNPVHLEANKLLISPAERELLTALKQKIDDNRLPMIEADAARNRPEAVRLALESRAARAQMQKIFQDVQERHFGSTIQAREPTAKGTVALPDRLPKREIPFQVGHVSVPPILEERPPWAPLESGTAVPQIPSDWALLHRMHSADVADIVNNTPAPGQPPFKTLKQGFIQKPGSREPMGAAQVQTLFRIASGGSSALLYGAAYNADDPRTRRYLRTAAGVLALLALMPRRDGWMSKRISLPGGKSVDVLLLHMYDLPAYLTATVGSHATESMKTATDLGNAYNLLNMNRTRDIKRMFPTPQLREDALRALDDPHNSIAWAKMSQDQKTFLAQEGLFNLHQHIQLQNAGVSRDMQRDILRHILPRKTFGALEAAETNPGTTSFTSPPGANAHISDYEAWAKANKLPAPIVDLAYVQSRHMGEVGRTLMQKQMVNEMTRIGLLIPATDNVPDGWKVPSKVPGMGKLMAPDGVAIALERMDKPNGDGNINNGLLRLIDNLRGWQLRTIMAWPLVHSLNQVRRILSMGVPGVLGAMENLKAGALASPSAVRAASFGTDLSGSRTDYSTSHQNAMEGVFNQLALRTGGFGKIALQPIGNFFGAFEKGLWERLVPATGLTAFNIHLNNWVKATDGAFSEGSPEFTAAGHRAASFANTMMGKSASVLRSPGLEYFLRQAFFAPHWFESNIKINLTALGEVRGLLSGKTSLSDVAYLPVKIRSTIISLATVYGLSKLLTGKAPQFNPQSEKLYAHTGVVDRNGRELGFDPNGYWSDDIKMFGDPTMYFMNRLSPMLQYGHTVMTGRDAFGRVITDENLIDAGVQGLGPISTVTKAIARHYNGSDGMTSADMVRSGAEVSQVGSISALPHINELGAQKLAHRLLRLNGLPADDPDKIYELQQMILAAQKSHKNVFSKQTSDWIARQKQTQKSQNPSVAAVEHGWQKLKGVLRTTAGASRVPSTIIPSTLDAPPPPRRSGVAPTREQYNRPTPMQ